MGRRFGTIVVLLIVALGTVAPAVDAAPAPGAAVERPFAVAAAGFVPDAEECAMLGLINTHRAKSGLTALALSPTLSAAADHHSVDMATHNYFSHTLADGTTWSENIADHGYPTMTSRAENIAAGNADAARTFGQWRDSAGHNEHMLGGKYTAIGIGRAYNADSRYDHYWTTTFGSKVDAVISCGGDAAPVPYRIVGSGRSSGSTSSAYAYDGKSGSDWHTTASEPPRRGYVYFDLGAVKSIGTIKWMYARTGYADSLRIQVSNDKSTWTTIATKGNAKSANTWQTLKWSGKARYVRFYYANPNGDANLGYLSEVAFAA